MSLCAQAVSVDGVLAILHAVGFAHADDGEDVLVLPSVRRHARTPQGLLSALTSTPTPSFASNSLAASSE